MNLYLDTSSLLKLVLNEIGSVEARAAVDQAPDTTTSLVAWPECRAGLARALRGGRLSNEESVEALVRLAGLWNEMRVIVLTETLAHKAGDLAARHFLRGLDAIHLASAVTLRDELREPVSFSSFDGRLNEAAADCGLTVV